MCLQEGQGRGFGISSGEDPVQEGMGCGAAEAVRHPCLPFTWSERPSRRVAHHSPQAGGGCRAALARSWGAWAARQSLRAAGRAGTSRSAAGQSAAAGSSHAAAARTSAAPACAGGGSSGGRATGVGAAGKREGFSLLHARSQAASDLQITNTRAARL